MIKVIDNFIPLDEQEEIKDLFLGYGTSFPWFFKSDVTFKNGTQNRPAMAHTFVWEGKTISPFEAGAIRLGKIGAEKADYQFNSVLNARTFLQFPLNPNFLKDDTPDSVHIDTPTKHLVVLYYVVTADGDTLIGDQRVTPMQGRAVLFDGSIYHTAEQPKHNIRCVININVV